MAEDYRPLTDYERAVTRRLLRAVERGRTQLVSSLSHCGVRIVDEYQDSYGSIEFRVSPRVVLDTPLPISEGEAVDRDGVPILFILFTKGDELFELEIVKADGSEIISKPDASAIRLRKTER